MNRSAMAPIVALLFAFCLDAQTPAPQAAPAAASIAPAAQQSPQEVFTLRKQVNLVLISVVVRDKKGRPVGSLKRGDFRILDDGKPQAISAFSMETNAAGKGAQNGSALATQLTSGIGGAIPLHYFAYLFDDIHLRAGDLMQVREAAEKHLASGMGPQDRAAVFTTSGDVTTQFTGDTAELTQAMNKIKPALSLGSQCPYLNHYLAQRIVYEFGNGGKYQSGATPVWDAATVDALYCVFQETCDSINITVGSGPGTTAPPLGCQEIGEARNQALIAARREVSIGDENTRRSLLAVRSMVRRLAAMPGSRTLILVSPGFLAADDHSEQEFIVDLATRQNIVVNALDARGLYTGVAGTDNESGPSSPTARSMESPYLRQAMNLKIGVLAELADGTGGNFFRDSNDLAGGFDQVGEVPEYTYELGFSPTELTHPGRYHTLKIELAEKRGWSVQARPGYSESGADTPEKQLSAELEQALFSHDQVQSFPIAVNSGYSKKDLSHRELAVVTHIDLGSIQFRKANGAGVDGLTLVCGLFDINGNYLQGKKRELSLRLSNDAFQRFKTGMNVATTFDVPPGAYMIRVVVRDSGTGLLSTANGSGIIQ